MYRSFTLGAVRIKCHDCGRPPVPNHTRCVRHQLGDRLTNAEIKVLRAMQGQCLDCGGASRPSRSRCQRCATVAALVTRLYKKKHPGMAGNYDHGGDVLKRITLEARETINLGRI